MEQGESSPQLNSTKNDTNEINKYDFYEVNIFTGIIYFSLFAQNFL